MQSPLEVIELVGNKLIKETPFKYQLSVASPSKTFSGIQVIDFGRTFGLKQPAVAYAVTTLNAPEAMDFTMQLEHNDGCKIWLNNALVYEKSGERPINLKYEERGVQMSNECKLSLKKGKNILLVKSETAGKEWKVYMQPPSTKGAILNKTIVYPGIGLAGMKYIEKSLVNVSNWLVVGPFKNEGNTGLNEVFPPEKEIVFGYMYQGIDEPITWTIPKVEVLGGMINPKKWGTSYNWNYHNGGMAWAMEKLAELSGEKKYKDYAVNFCDFHLNGIPFVNYQVKTLNADSSANKEILGVPLLDFTLAPSLPLVYRLQKDAAFPNKAAYQQFVDKMINYAVNEQLRMPGSNIFTRLTPQKYTTWVDDMFMGIPFLVQASIYTQDATLKKKLLDDAANQVINFSTQVWDSNANLYRHAKFSDSNNLMPHWSRANGWGIWATSEVLMNLPKNHPQYKSILDHYRKHVSALVKLQNANGFWYNVLDRPDSKEEVSGTAIFTMAIARGVNNGWLDADTYKPVVMKAWNALKTKIDMDGTVHDICMGTMCSDDVNYYINRPYFDDDTHGLFAVMFAGIEVENLVKGKDLNKMAAK
ncbi:glycoside hydrolase family 105 protein [Parasediminibacterium sp. JCM 36343]|uniref:glycoside hydrolase family 88/105 protein n=1 Tax=Parasediminibacterium sp. JCM 36343 TaxID=3374279 RepID=UPI00397A18DE